MRDCRAESHRVFAFVELFGASTNYCAIPTGCAPELTLLWATNNPDGNTRFLLWHMHVHLDAAMHLLEVSVVPLRGCAQSLAAHRLSRISRASSSRSARTLLFSEPTLPSSRMPRPAVRITRPPES